MMLLFILLSLTGVLQVTRTLPLKYYLIQPGTTWSDAQVFCRANHGDLATIGSSTSVVRVQQDAPFSSPAWVGLSLDINSWKWSSGNTPVGVFRPWDSAAGEPNNIGGIQECGGIRPSGWFDIECSYLLPFVCFDATYPLLYAYYADLLVWSEALSFCRQHHTDLAFPRTSTENSLVLGLISGHTWLGLRRDPWRWSDQNSASSIPWLPGEPNNAGGSDNCGFLSNFQALDAPCSDVYPFFCHRLITGQKRLVKFKIESDLDVDEDWVKAAILEKIEDKLKDHGMSTDILLKWRKKPGGVVFKRLTGV